MTTQTAAIQTRTRFTAAKRRALRGLCVRYREQRDLFSAIELSRLRFVRYLVQSGRLVP